MKLTQQLGRSEIDWDRVWVGDEYSSPIQRNCRAVERFAAFKISELLTRTNGLVLDVACGSGALTRLLVDARLSGQKVIGFDRSKIALEIARKDNDVAFWVFGDARRLPFPDASVSLICAFGILEHIPESAELLAEFRRVLSSDGTALLSTSSARSALQLKNKLLDLLQLYKYGYQRNWTGSDLEPKLSGLFRIKRKFVLHSQNDMPIIRFVDRVIARVSSDWGRYLCYELEK